MASRYQAHQPVPEPRWRWLTGALAEMAVLIFAVVVVLAIAGLQS